MPTQPTVQDVPQLNPAPTRGRRGRLAKAPAPSPTASADPCASDTIQTDMAHPPAATLENVIRRPQRRGPVEAPPVLPIMPESAVAEPSEVPKVSEKVPEQVAVPQTTGRKRKLLDVALERPLSPRAQPSAAKRTLRASQRATGNRQAPCPSQAVGLRCNQPSPPPCMLALRASLLPACF